MFLIFTYNLQYKLNYVSKICRGLVNDIQRFDTQKIGCHEILTSFHIDFQIYTSKIKTYIRIFFISLPPVKPDLTVTLHSGRTTSFFSNFYLIERLVV